ncbi:nucleoside-diphosphate kinase [Candidatus Falkowbacteria bacterium]|jgi:nucleoside-diphosphate kinase|nr:nucleoside-diphosphate kinase [Candidatus Falkowbacteria bacterium]MBT4432740.1 nucleoside-diphosphate kinase [Candidatus Falkowbacteria bacterium]
MHPKQEKTLVIIKPDGIQRTLIGEIITRYERTGLKLMGLKMVIANEDRVEKHYTIDPEWVRKVGEKSIVSYDNKGIEPPSRDPEELGGHVLRRLKKYITSGPVIAMIWEGNQAVGIVRKITGGTEPLTSDVGTVRGDFTIDSYEIADTDDRPIRNLIHASGTLDEAKKEIALWFKKEEIFDYRLVQEQILYDVNMDGKPE